jgi:hypothetical protein
MPPRSWKGALLISGEPGTGKSRWIRDEAALAKAKIFQWNARTDRSLREGREKLHQQVRSKDRLFLWLEGADDLTQEAQAFLRRILETASPNVTCCLEVRELWKLSPPILSRCTVVHMRSDTSFRAARNESIAKSLGILCCPPPLEKLPDWNEIPELRKHAEDPYRIVARIQQEYGIKDGRVQELIRAIGAGSSPWIQVAAFLFERKSTASNIG